MGNDNKLREILDSFRNKKILVLGDVMVDEYLWGEVSRISPEAPVPVVSCNMREHRMGGAANVALNIKAMGAEPVICSVIGDDDAGIVFKQLLDKRGMIKEGLVTSRSRKTTIKTRIIGNHQHLLRVDHEITQNVDQDLERKLLAKIEALSASYTPDAIIFQDYDKGVITRKIIQELIKKSKLSGIPTLVDPKKNNFLEYQGSYLFKPNFKEISEGLNMRLNKNNTEGIAKAAGILHEEYNIANIIITLSEKGIFVSDGSSSMLIPAVERDVADVSGAGDTVIAIAALATAIGLDVFKTARLANLAGGIVCEKVGVVPITPAMLGTHKNEISFL